MGCVPLVKFIEDPFNGPGIHAGTMVFYSKYKVSAAFINADGNRSSFRGKFDRIVDQVDPDLSEQGTVSGKADLLDLQVKGDFFFDSISVPASGSTPGPVLLR